MVLVEDIFENIVSNGGKILEVTPFDSSIKITYVDADGNKIVKCYKQEIDDETGEENWPEMVCP